NPRKYFVHIRWNNKELIYPLPGISQYACQLSLLSQSDEAFNMRVALGDSLYKQNEATYILGVSHDSVCFAASGIGMYDVSVPKNVFPHGKATLFLFNDQHQMVCQRSIYIPDNNSRVSITTDKTNYGPREKVKLNINIFRVGDLPLTALFSIGVIDDRFSVPEEIQKQLSGFITNDSAMSETEIMEQKEYSPEETDLIMLLEKDIYSKWKYTDDANAIPVNSRHAENNYSGIGGTMLNKKNEPLKNYVVHLFSEDKTIFRTDTTDSKGHFLFSLPDFDDGTAFNLKLTNIRGQGQEGKVILDKFDFPQFKTPLQLKKGFDKEELSVIQNFKTHLLDTLNYPNEKNLLKSVTIKGEKRKTVNYDETKRVSVFSDIITSDKFNKGDRYAILNAIAAVPGFNTGPSLSSGNASGVLPLLVMDGVIINPPEGLRNFLMNYEQNSIDFIEILKGPQTAIYGIQGAGGVILINSTNKRNEIASINDKGLTTIFPKGYFKQADFSVPDYDNAAIKNSSYPDLRSTIYWNGNIITDKQDTKLYFFAGDMKTNYAITLTGITANGDILCKTVKLNKK
ncbi:MAG TPA: TonB-dependent receptor plug domain-containing protein, partial [Puia sp.]|nr:TonB-dependent receptor plug domain-containing protein [Puia sp.]